MFNGLFLFYFLVTNLNHLVLGHVLGFLWMFNEFCKIHHVLSHVFGYLWMFNEFCFILQYVSCFLFMSNE